MVEYLPVVLVGLMVLSVVSGAEAGTKMDLNGDWEFRMDPDGVGEAERWFASAEEFPLTMRVPGTWNAGGAGEASENLFHSFSSPAWYRRVVSLPGAWKGKVIHLKFGGVHRYADVWVNGQFVGKHIAYVTPFEFDISRFVSDGRRADIVVRVDAVQNTEIDPLYGCFDVMDMGPLTWGGMYRGVELEATESAWIDYVQVIPHIGDSTAEVRTEIAGSLPSTRMSAAVEIRDADGKVVGKGMGEFAQGSFVSAVRVVVPNARLWCPLDPYLYTVKSRLLRDGKEIHSKSDRFGMREVGTCGKDFMLNGRPIYLRGYGDDCIFPNTVAPPADKAEYYHRFKIAKSFGFNHVRHHSWFPLDEYFDVADELGITLQPEFPVAYEHNYDPSTPEKRKLYLDSWRELIKRNCNHPSIITWCMGNELWEGHELAAEMHEIAKTVDPTRLVISTDGVYVPPQDGKVPDVLDFSSVLFGELIEFGLNDGKYDKDLRSPKPILAHEMSNFASLPNLTQTNLFRDGVRPFWLYKLKENVEARGLSDVYPRWVENSNKLQAVMLKTNTEAARRSMDVRGYHQWLLQDYWNASNGVFDIFYRPKGLSAEEYRQFNSPTVLLIDAPSRSFRSGETVGIPLLVSRFEDAPSRDAVVKWRLKKGRATVASGTLKGLSISDDGVQAIETLSITMPEVTKGEKLVLTAELSDENGKAVNEWNLWVYPKERLEAASHVCISAPRKTRELYPWATQVHTKEIPADCDLLITSSLSEQVIDYVEKGGRVLLLGAGGVFKSTVSSYRSCWWVGDSGKDSNTGTVVDTAHPAVEGMPNDGWCDLNFANLLTGSKAVFIDELPVKVDPIIRCLDVHETLRNKAYLFEAKVGEGRLLASSLNFAGAVIANDPSGVYLLDRLIEYALGGDFAPEVRLPADYLRKIVQSLPVIEQIPLPESALRVNGFDGIVGSSNNEMQHPSYRDPSRRSWIVHQTDGKNLVRWKSDPVPAHGEGRVSLMWTSAMGCAHEPSGSFTVHLGGKPLLEFDVTLKSRKWTSSDGRAEMIFEVKKVVSQDAFGVMCLTVPGEMLEVGKPAMLSVTGHNSSSERWFMVFDYRDTVDQE